MENHSKKLAKGIDLTLNYLMDIHDGKTKDSNNVHKIQSKLYSIDKVYDSTFYGHVINILVHQKYVEPIYDEEKSYKELLMADEGLLLYLNGGLLSKIKLEEKKSILYTVSLWAVIIAGIYYIKEIF